MAAFHPTFDTLPAEISIFPLAGALLLPRGRLPLNIFEPRYLALTLDALAEGRMFGMVQPDPGVPRTDAGPGLYGMGCVGRLSSFAESDDGRLLITLTGLIRFRLLEERPMRRGYRRVAIDCGPFRDDLDLNAPDRSFDRPALVDAMRPFFRARGIDPNWEAIEQTSDEMLVLTLAMVCPFEPREKQALLEAASLEDRAATLIALMRMGAHARWTGDGAPDERPS